MQTIQLYIENTRVDMFKDESVTITDTIKNVKDISKVFTEFSQQFSLPASRTNNKLFKHYYNWDIDNSFDARVRASSTIQLNGTDFKKGKIKLNSVELKNNKPHSYKIVFYGKTVDLKSIVGDDKLNNLAFVEVKKTGTATSTTSNELIDTGENFETTVSAGDRIRNDATGIFATIESVDDNETLTIHNQPSGSAWTINSGQAYTIYLSPIYEENAVKHKMSLQPATAKNSLVTPLISHTRRFIWDSGTNNTNTETLINVRFNASASARGIEYTDLKFALRVDEIIKAIENTYTTTNGYPISIDFTTDFFSSSNADYYNLFMWLNRKSGEVDTSTAVQAYTFTCNSFTGGAGGDTGFLGDGQNVFVSPDNLTDFQIDIDAGAGNTTNPYTITVFRNGAEIYSESSPDATSSWTILPADLGLTDTTATGTYQIQVAGDAAVIFDEIKFTVSGYYYDDDGVQQTNTNVVMTTGAFTSPAIATFDVADQMPEIKVIDFLTGMFKMFNLVAYVNDEDKIEVRTLDNTSSDSYYNLSSINTWDITDYIDVSKSNVKVALPFKEVKFSYEGLKSFLAVNHEQLFNQEWGTESWNEDSASQRIDGTTYNVKLPFDHFKYERLLNITGGATTTVQYGWSVNESQNAYKGKPLMFYPLKQSSADSIAFLLESGSDVGLSTYIIPSNSRYLADSSGEQNINFGAMINEYERPAVAFTGTLFENYYKNYITNIFNTKSRIIKVTAYLPLKIILQYKLNDTIVISGKSYRINSIKINLLTNKTDLELITKP